MSEAQVGNAPESHWERQKRHLREAVEKDIATAEDGFYHYWPSTSGGFLSAWQLRTIADILDEKNVPWKKQIDEYFEARERQELKCDVCGK